MNINHIKLISMQLMAALFLSVSCGQKSGHIEFQTFHWEDFEKHPQGVAENDGFSYKIDFQYPSQYSDKAVLERLQTLFVRYTLGDEFALSMGGANGVTLERAVDDYIALYKKAYYSYIDEMQGYNSDPNFITGWHVECSNAILFENETLLQLQTKDGLYPTAAQVWESASHHLFNLLTGDEYRWDDLFKPGAAEEIRRQHIPELSEYTKIDFALTDQGVYFVYDNDYDEFTDFMPQSATVTLLYRQILPYLREGTPVWEVASGR